VDRQLLGRALQVVQNRGARAAAILILSAFLAGQIAWSLAAAEESRRFWWLWPLQSLAISFGAVAMSQALRRKRLAAVLIGIPLALSAAVPLIANRLIDWRRVGWAGNNDPLIQLLDETVDHDGREAGNGGVAPISVSYDIPVSSFTLAANTIDSRYRPGMAYDVYLKHRYGVQPAVMSADSFSPESRYLIRQSRSLPEGATGWIAFQHPDEELEGFVLVAQASNFSLWRHHNPPLLMTKNTSGGQLGGTAGHVANPGKTGPFPALSIR
jgi:hypothetical protein